MNSGLSTVIQAKQRRPWARTPPRLIESPLLEGRRRFHPFEAVVGSMRLVAGELQQQARDSAESRLSSWSLGTACIGECSIAAAADPFKFIIYLESQFGMK